MKVHCFLEERSHAKVRQLELPLPALGRNVVLNRDLYLLLGLVLLYLGWTVGSGPWELLAGRITREQLHCARPRLGGSMKHSHPEPICWPLVMLRVWYHDVFQAPSVPKQVFHPLHCQWVGFYRTVDPSAAVTKSD